ncbi:MAG: hypothetical protein ACXWJB_03410 [Limisphaerales bacterium]
MRTTIEISNSLFKQAKTRIFSATVFCAVLTLLAIPAQARDARVASKRANKVVTPSVGLLPEDITPEAAEVVWLYHHGLENEKLLRYVNRSHADFNLSVVDVNYLKDIGLSTDVVVAMVRTDKAREEVARLRSRERLLHVSPASGRRA